MVSQGSRLCEHRTPGLFPHEERAMFHRVTVWILSIVAVVTEVQAEEIVRRQPGDFPIASSVLVPANAELVFLSGTLADVVKPDAPAGSVERLGDTETQAASVLDKLAKELAASGLSMADVVKMNVFLVGDPQQGGKMDFVGLMKAYTRHFGAATGGRLPTRTTVQVAGLPIPGALVEIEVIAARTPAK
jgi:enamine deaminase RidA (YjgF/YER057c/UK114 family)